MSRLGFYSFRIPPEEEDIIELLEKAPNRSDLIRKALRYWIDGNNAIFQDLYQTAYQEAYEQASQELLQKIDIVFRELEKHPSRPIATVCDSRPAEEDEDIELVIDSELTPLTHASPKPQVSPVPTNPTNDKIRAKILAGIRKLQVIGEN